MLNYEISSGTTEHSNNYVSYYYQTHTKRMSNHTTSMQFQAQLRANRSQIWSMEDMKIHVKSYKYYEIHTNPCRTTSHPYKINVNLCKSIPRPSNCMPSCMQIHTKSAICKTCEIHAKPVQVLRNPCQPGMAWCQQHKNYLLIEFEFGKDSHGFGTDLTNPICRILRCVCMVAH